ncbi:MAG: phosphoribosyltransferase family protein [Nevskia sp.]|nr:phosphoribosyltransferase family protein [Nevskia sp.]
MRFHDRHHAGQALAEALKPHLEGPAIVYALPRGGVPLAVEVARACSLPLDLVIPRKIGHPHQPEYAICAVTETGEPICNEDERRAVDPQWLAQRIEAERREARRRRELYSGGQARRSARGRCAILVDDGIATGLTMEAAVAEVRQDNPTRLIVAVPVAPRDTAERFAGLVDRFVAVQIPEFYAGAVGYYYEDFRQLSDRDVQEELARLPAAEPQPAEE